MSQQFHSPTYEEISAVTKDIFSTLADQPQGLFILSEVALPNEFIIACNQCPPLQAYLMGIAIGMRIQQRRTENQKLEDLLGLPDKPPTSSSAFAPRQHRKATSLARSPSRGRSCCSLSWWCCSWPAW